MPSFSNEPLIVIAACCFILLLCLFIILFVISYQKSTYKFLQEKQLMESAFKEELLHSQMEVQEATLSSLSKELHDNIGQLLSTTKMLIGITERSISNPPDTLHTANETLGKAISELRSLSKSMNKEWLEQFNLLENLMGEVNRINSTNTIKVHLSAVSDSYLKADEQIILFRIIQEAIQNSIKHADAGNIFIDIANEGSNLAIKVKDDGKGFNQTEAKNGLGLMHLKQRTQILGGTINWITQEKNGCTVLIEIPLKNSNP